jgi:acyl-CoA synthetase (AMP-forming)/AMP-acid ligase II
MGLYDILLKTAKDNPDNLAVICGDIKYSYSELKKRADALSHSLRGTGIQKDDKIAIISQNCHRYLEIYFATTKLGAVSVPINYRLAPDDFIYILNNSNAKVLFAQPQFISWLEKERSNIPLLSNIVLMEAQLNKNNIDDYLEYEDLIINNLNKDDFTAEVSDSECAQIYYTSGTTGTPKGVVLTHRNNEIHSQGTIKELDLSESDRWLHVSPMFHLADSWAVWSMTQVAGVHVIVPSFESKSVLKAIEDHKVTLSNFIPTMLNILVNYPEVKNHDASSLRLIMSGGAPIAKEVVRKIIDIFQCNYIQTYGLTETSPFLTMSILKDEMKSLPFEERLDILVTTGRPFYNVQLKVVKENGAEVMPNGEDVGEIIVMGETISPEYWDLPEETKERIVDGWLFTRDLAVMDHKGYVTIVDRKDDMIITGGENVYSIEVENVLYSHPSILEAAVIGLPHPIWGECVAAVVVLKREISATEDEIIEFCKQNMAHFKAPKQVIFIDSLPKTGSAKIYKYRLREMYRRN